MQSTSEGELNIAELANQLRREKIFINSERQLLQNLNTEVERSALELLQVAWICSQQRQNLTNVITSKCEADSMLACQRASLLDFTTFVDVYKVIKYKEAIALGELLGWLRDSPHLVSLCLLLGEEHMPLTLPSSLVAGLYGSCRSPLDRTRLLAVIRSLIKHQLAPSNDPRKFFRTGKCALAQLYAIFRDGHTPARQFLIAALHGPIMTVLQEDEFFLDIDPDKAMERFTHTDRLKKFGQTNSQEYNVKTARYRKWTVESLVNLTNKFINSLKENWANFPATIAWVVQQIVHLLKQHSRVSERELHYICTDLVLNHFICPAIVNPEAHGVVEIPVSYIARFNLIQIAQIIQMLCLARYQEVDLKVRDLYVKFEKSCVWSLLEALAVGSAHAPDVHLPPPDHSSLRTEPPTHTTVALFTRQELHSLIIFLKKISSKLNNNTPSVTSEELSSSSGKLVDNLPYPEVVRVETGSTSTSEGSSSTDDGYTASLTALLQSIEPNYRSRLHDLLRKLPDFSKIRLTTHGVNKENHQDHGPTNKRSILAKVPKPRLPRSTSSNTALVAASISSDEKVVNGEVSKEEDLEHPEVLIIKLANVEEHDYVGLIPESKVLECYYGSDAADADDTGSALAVTGPGAPVQKRTRFSVSHDEVSLGNTSDNLEAVSEAASNHSVTSSLELETEDQNDNLSDMVSANVSGRGSPNISGRETPSSQVTDGDGGVVGDVLPVRRIPQVPVNQEGSVQAKLLKQTHNDIEDKFCKFEIKKLLEGDETISIMSDTWSTDVLASDSETIGDTCDQTQIAANQAIGPTNANAPDVSETASESAWSMDVLASDSDRNTEVDTDDCVSVAARSDSSWSRRPSHQDESTPTRVPLLHSGNKKDVGSPRNMSRLNFSRPLASGGGPNMAYLNATSHLNRGAELDLTPRAPVNAPVFNTAIDNRKSILVNGYPVMTCYTTSAPDSPSNSTPATISNDVFDYVPSNSDTQSESTVDGGAGVNSDATSQWVDDSFPQPNLSPSNDERPFNLPTTSKNYDSPSTSKPFDMDNDAMEQSLNSSENSFNASSASLYDRSRFDSGIESANQRSESEQRPTITDLMTKMSSATISTSANLVNNLTSRIVKSEIRTSIVSISSSRMDWSKRNEHTLTANNVSLSTLSVNSGETSISDKSSSQDVNSENATERRVSPPPIKLAHPSTGAIPKSISFDATAEKSQRRRMLGDESVISGNFDELKNNVKRSGGNLLHKIKMFRQKGRSSIHQSNANDIKLTEEEQRSDDRISRVENSINTESSEDILAKYRRKSSSDSSRGRRSSRRSSDPPLAPDVDVDSSCEGVVNLNDPEVFNCMKRKLRMVLSNPDLHFVEYVPNRCTSTSLVEWVRAAAASSDGEAGAAHAGEIARALAGCTKGVGVARLAAALRADLAARRPYAAYLASCRAGLTHTLHAINKQITLIRAECAGCARAAAAARVLEQLERAHALRRLLKHHHARSNQALLNGGELMDEKASRLTASIKAITAEVKADPSWEGATPALLEMADITVERAAFARLYLHVLFPNGEGDIARDQVLSDHIRKLSSCTSAASVGVAQRHVWAAPFARAQQYLAHLSVFKTPRDKVSCIMRCITCIMAILGLNEGDAPSADDLTPVLVYVIIRVNPPSLLSTIQLVNALGGPVLQGEAVYWWTHFCAAVAYIKTMDYPRPPPSQARLPDS